MSTNKNISALFQDGSQRLTVQPSPQSWSKVRRRLDGQMRHSRTVLMWWVVSAAAILVLVCTVYFSQAFKKPQDVAAGPAPKHLEDLTPSKNCSPYCQLLEKRKLLPAGYTTAIQK